MSRNRKKGQVLTAKAIKIHFSVTVILLIGDYGKRGWYQVLVARGRETVLYTFLASARSKNPTA